MGVPGKWIKALVGLKKSEKPESSEKNGNVSIALSLSLCLVSYISFILLFLTFSDHHNGALGLSVVLSLGSIKRFV